jgi:large subunit ribosomal protein L1
MTIGKVSFGADKLLENLRVVYDALTRVRPSTIKGSYIKNVSVASTMGPGVKVDSESIAK